MAHVAIATPAAIGSAPVSAVSAATRATSGSSGSAACASCAAAVAVAIPAVVAQCCARIANAAAVIGSVVSILRARSISARAVASRSPSSSSLADRADASSERRGIRFRSGVEPLRRFGAGVVAGIRCVRGEHAARRLRRGTELLVGDRVRELLECAAELVGAAIEECELELREQRAHVGRRAVEDLAGGHAREIVLAAREQQVDAVMPERPALERARDGELGIELTHGLDEIARGAAKAPQPAQRGGGARIREQRGVVVRARPFELAEPFAQPAGLDAQRRRRLALVDGRDLALVDLERACELLVELRARQRLDLLGELDRLEIELRLVLLLGLAFEDRQRRRDAAHARRCGANTGERVVGRGVGPRHVGQARQHGHRRRSVRARQHVEQTRRPAAEALDDRVRGHLVGLVDVDVGVGLRHRGARRRERGQIVELANRNVVRVVVVGLRLDRGLLDLVRNRENRRRRRRRVHRRGRARVATRPRRRRRRMSHARESARRARRARRRPRPRRRSRPRRSGTRCRRARARPRSPDPTRA